MVIANDPYAGLWQISNPFGGVAVSELFFQAIPIGRNVNDGASNSDYSIFSVTTASVPEPATMLLLGTGLIGLAGLGRKRFLKK